MAKEKKKSDWENLQEMLSQNSDDWTVAEASNAPAVETATETDEAEAEGEKSVAKTPVAKPKRACAEKKPKTARARKKAAPKTDKIDAALAAPVDAAPQDAETVDLTVADPEKAPKKRRRATKKAEQDETELVKNVLKLESETKAKKRARAKAAVESPFVGLLSQIERVAQAEPEAEAEPETPETEAETETALETEIEEVVEIAAPEADADVAPVESGDFFAEFFADSNVEELEISWGRPRVNESETLEETDAEPETSAPCAVAEPEPETLDAESGDAEAENAATPRRRERRRRRRDDRAPREEADAEVDAPASDDAKTAVDLNDLEAFFATDSDDEDVGFAPRREAKKAQKTERPERVEKASVETAAQPPVSDEAFDLADDEDDEDRRSKRKRRRRRGGRRSFEDDVETTAFEDDADGASDAVVAEPETDADSEIYEAERAPRERDRRRRERRPRREREAVDETPENDERESSDDRRAVAPERVLPSWSDAISHVVRFNMSRRVNRRR